MKTIQFNEEQIKNEMIAYTIELRKLFTEGKDLREISRWSYAQRESGRNIPYMAICDSNDKGKTISGLWATPISKQKELKAFFDMTKAELSMLSKYTLSADLTGIHFYEKSADEEGNIKKTDLI